MTKLLTMLAAAALCTCAGSAYGGALYFTAFKDNKKIEVKDPKSKITVAGKEIRVYSQADFEKLSDSKKKENTETVTMCEAKYYLSKKDMQWKKAHEDAKHEIRVRDNVSPGKYQ